MTTIYARTYYVGMNVTLSIDDEIMRQARKRAEAMGTSVNQLVRDYLAQFALASQDGAEAARRFQELTRQAKGDSRGWKFNREEIHKRA